MKCLSPFYLDSKLAPERFEMFQKLHLPPKLAVRCGKCMPCRIYKRKLWTLRCMHEASKHTDNSFITLTFNDENCPFSLTKYYLQKFIKRLRRNLDYYSGVKVRYYGCGEYGDINQRPHYHLIVFGWFPGKGDVYVSNKKMNGKLIYSSRLLDKLWPFGYNTIGTVTSESISYVASYVEKKIISRSNLFTEDGRLSPFSLFSKGIGDITKFNSDRLYFSFKGKYYPVPRYYRLKNEFGVEISEIYDKLKCDITNYDQLKIDFDSMFKLFSFSKKL